MAILTAISILTVLCVFGLVDNYFLWPNFEVYLAFRRWFQWVEWAIPAEFAAVFLLPAITQRKRWIWSALFWNLVLSCLSPYAIVILDAKTYISVGTIFLLALMIVGGLATLLLAMLIAGVVSDRRHREPRHWLHWSAVVL